MYICIYVFSSVPSFALVFAAVLGNECSPIPLPPLVVGYEHEWMSVSPLCLPHWVSIRLCLMNVRMIVYVCTYVHTYVPVHPGTYVCAYAHAPRVLYVRNVCVMYNMFSSVCTYACASLCLLALHAFVDCSLQSHSVSFLQDSMMFEPYSCKKDLLYIAFVPESHKLVSTSQAYFKEMSVTYEVRTKKCVFICSKACLGSQPEL